MNSTKVIIIGDSNTEGFGLSHNEDSYPNKIQRLLPHTHIYNMGLTGSCVIHSKKLDRKIVGFPYFYQEKYTKAISLCGDIYIINLGTNDGQDGMDDCIDVQNPLNNLIAQKAYFKKDYLHLIDGIKVKNPKAQIILCIPIPINQCIWRKHKQKYMDQLIPYIKEIAIENAYPLIDLYSNFKSLNSNQMNSLYLSDGLHLNSSGTSFVASILSKIISQIIIC